MNGISSDGMNHKGSHRVLVFVRVVELQPERFDPADGAQDSP
jgi:hypothetical protein